MSAHYRPATLWHNEARALRALGFEPSAIARRLGKSISMVRWALDENGEKAETLARVHKHRLPKNVVLAAAKISTHTPRAVRRILDRDAVMPAARAYAAGMMTREQMLAVITVRK